MAFVLVRKNKNGQARIVAHYQGEATARLAAEGFVGKLAPGEELSIATEDERVIAVYRAPLQGLAEDSKSTASS